MAVRVTRSCAHERLQLQRAPGPSEPRESPPSPARALPWGLKPLSTASDSEVKQTQASPWSPPDNPLLVWGPEITLRSGSPQYTL